MNHDQERQSALFKSLNGKRRCIQLLSDPIEVKPNEQLLSQCQINQSYISEEDQEDQLQGKKMAQQFEHHLGMDNQNLYQWQNQVQATKFIAHIFFTQSQQRQAIINTLKLPYQQQWSAYYQNQSCKTYLFVNQFDSLEYILALREQTCSEKFIKQIRIILKTISNFCLSIINQTWFQYLILLVIIFNTVIMTIKDPTQQDTQLDKDLELFFNIFYTIQMTIKILALGFILNSGAYLRDSWNILDFTIVITSWLPVLIDDLSFSVTAFRSLRVLRPLRTITRIKALKQIIQTLFSAISLIIDTIIIMLFFILIFGIAGLQLFGGMLKKRCIEVESGIVLQQLCMDCNEGYECGRSIDNPNQMNNFDTIGWSLLNIFQIITMQGWSEIMQNVQSTVHYLTVFYFLPIIIIGSFVLISLLLVIIKYKFSQAHEKQQEQNQNQQFSYDVDLIKQIKIKQQQITLYQKINNVKKEDVQKIVGDLHVGTYYGLPVGRDKAKERLFNDNHQFKKKRQKKIPKSVKIIQKLNTQSEQEELVNKKLRLEIKPKIYEKQELPPQGQELLKRLKWQNINISIKKHHPKVDILVQPELPIQQLSITSIDTQILLKGGQNNNEKYYQQLRIKQKNEELFRLRQKQRVYPVNEDIQTLLNCQIPIQQKNIKKYYDQYFDDSMWKRYQKSKRKQNQDKSFTNITKIARRNKRFTARKITLQKKKQKEMHSGIQILKLSNQLADKRMKIRIKSKQILNTLQYSTKLNVMSAKLLREDLLMRKILHSNIFESGFKVIYQLDSKSKQVAEQKIKQLMPPIKLKCLSILKKETAQQLTLYNYDTNSPIQQNAVLINNQNNVKKFQIQKLEKKPKVGQLKLRGKKKLQKVEEVIDFYFSQRQQKNQQKKEDFNVKKLKKKQKKQPKKVKKQTFQSNEAEYIMIRKQDFEKGQNVIRTQITHQILQKKIPTFILSSISTTKHHYIQWIAGYSGCIQITRDKLRKFAFSPFFDNLMILAVIANTVVLALPGIVNDSQILHTLNIMFTIVFAFDCSVKIAGIGMKYFRWAMNVFDFFVVVISIYQLSLISNGGGSAVSAFRSIRIFRAFRVLRVARVLRSLQYMQVIIRVVSSTFSQFIYILMLLFLFILIYTLTAMQFFGDSQKAFTIRQSFSSFLYASEGVFQVMTAENWNDLLLLNIQSSGLVISLIFNISWIFIGNYVLLNLFMAILLGGFQQNQQQMQPEQLKKAQQQQKMFSLNQNTLSSTKRFTKTTKFEQTKSVLFNGIDCEQSLYIFSKQNTLRKICHRIVKFKHFQKIIQIAILISSAKLIYDTYIHGNQTMTTISYILDVIITVFFGIQAILKIINQGFILDNNSYLRDKWSILDFIIIVISVIDVSNPNLDLAFIKVMRLLRTLRPLRFISTNLNMKIIVISLFQSTSGIFNVTIVMVLVWLMFGILFMNLMRDKLNYCYAPDYQDTSVYDYNQLSVQFTYQCSQSFLPHSSWRSHYMNFDNIGHAMLSLFVFGNRQDWPTYMYQWIDSQTDQPVQNNNYVVYYLLSILFIFVGSFFLINLFLGVIFMNYRAAQKRIRINKLNDQQTAWINLQRFIVNSNPQLILYVEPQSRFQKFVINSQKVFQNLLKYDLLRLHHAHNCPKHCSHDDIDG